MFGKLEHQKELESMIENIGRSYLRGHRSNSPEGRAELAGELRAAAQAALATGNAKAVQKAGGYRSVLISALPAEARREAESIVQAALAVH